MCVWTLTSSLGSCALGCGTVSALGSWSACEETCQRLGLERGGADRVRGGVTSDLGLLRSLERDLRRSRLRDRSLRLPIAGADAVCSSFFKRLESGERLLDREPERFLVMPANTTSSVQEFQRFSPSSTLQQQLIVQ